VKEALKVCEDIYMIGGSGLSHAYDCSVYLIDAGELILIDCGAGPGFDRLMDNIRDAGLDPARLKAILVTHAHIDHIGALKRFRDEFELQVIAHDLDADRIESGKGIGSDVYGLDYDPCEVTTRIYGDEHTLKFGKHSFNMIHIPGHTPGSMAIYMDTADGRVLFGQDIHGPYLPEWGADIRQALKSLQRMIELHADILCEGHFGIYRPARAVERYIRSYLNSL